MDRDELEGTAPYPDVGCADLGATRIVDLRGLPRAALEGFAGVEFAGDVIACEAPKATFVWIVPSETVSCWASQMEEIRVLRAAMMRGAHRVPGRDFVHAPGHSWTPEQTTALAIVGLVPAVEGAVTVIDTQQVIRIGEVIEALDDIRPTGPARPVLDAVHHGLFLVDTFARGLGVTEIERYAFVDFRAESNAALDSGRVFYWVEQALGALGRAIDTVVWIFGPWTLERWSPERAPVLERFRGLVAMRPRAHHALALYGEAADPEMIRGLVALGMGPVEGVLRSSRDGVTFAIPPVTAARDAVLWRMAVARGVVAG